MLSAKKWAKQGVERSGGAGDSLTLGSIRDSLDLDRLRGGQQDGSQLRASEGNTSRLKVGRTNERLPGDTDLGVRRNT